MTQKNYLAIFAKSFNWAGFFLPKKIYSDCAKLYAFCRVLDDMVDEKTDLKSKVERFNKMRDFLKNEFGEKCYMSCDFVGKQSANSFSELFGMFLEKFKITYALRYLFIMD